MWASFVSNPQILIPSSIAPFSAAFCGVFDLNLHEGWLIPCLGLFYPCNSRQDMQKRVSQAIYLTVDYFSVITSSIASFLSLFAVFSIRIYMKDD